VSANSLAWSVGGSVGRSLGRKLLFVFCRATNSLLIWKMPSLPLRNFTQLITINKLPVLCCAVT